MEWGIETDGKLLAKFTHESDRDICLDALAEYYDDCEFKAVHVASG